MRYTVVYEEAPNNWAAYVPDLPGCVATGKTRAEVRRRIREAIELHLDAMRGQGERLPEAGSAVEVIEV